MSKNKILTKEMLLHLAAGGENFKNSELYTKEMLIHLLIRRAKRAGENLRILIEVLKKNPFVGFDCFQNLIQL